MQGFNKKHPQPRMPRGPGAPTSCGWHPRHSRAHLCSGRTGRTTSPQQPPVLASSVTGTGKARRGCPGHPPATLTGNARFPHWSILPGMGDGQTKKCGPQVTSLLVVPPRDAEGRGRRLRSGLPRRGTVPSVGRRSPRPSGRRRAQGGSGDRGLTLLRCGSRVSR